MAVVHNVQVVGLFCKLMIVHRQQLREFEGRWKIFTETEFRSQGYKRHCLHRLTCSVAVVS